MKTKRTRTHALPLIAREGEKALQAAVAEVVEEHKRTGRPLAVWRNGSAVLLRADEAVAAVRESRGAYRTKTGR